MLIEEFLSGVEASRPIPRFGSHSGNSFRRYGCRLVAEVITDVGEYRGKFLVIEHSAEGSHGHLTVEVLSIDLHGAD